MGPLKPDDILCLINAASLSSLQISMAKKKITFYIIDSIIDHNNENYQILKFFNII